MRNISLTDMKKGVHVGFFNSYVLQRIKRNKNFICCLTGQTGSGKSYSALRLGELLDSDMDIRNVCFSPLEFIQLVNGKSKRLKRGSVIIYDEVQVSMSAQDFQSLQAKLINACLQTFRFKGFILIMTSPFFHFINKSARKLFHSRIETITIDHKKKLCVLKPLFLQTNQQSGVTYEKYLRVYSKATGLVPYKRLRVALPTEPLRKAYEDKRQEFSNKLNLEIEKSLIKAQSRGAKQESDKYPQFCPKCKYEWNSPVEHPYKCPRCQYKQVVYKPVSAQNDITTTAQKGHKLTPKGAENGKSLQDSKT